MVDIDPDWNEDFKDEIEKVEGVDTSKTTDAKLEKDSKISHNINKDVDIEIDELTPCLRRISDNKIVDTTIEEVKVTKKFSKELKQQGWQFDWFKSQQEGYKIYQLKANGDDRIKGLLASKLDKENLLVNVGLVESAPFNSRYNKKVTPKEYNGVGGHLFAEAVKQSYENGFGGFVFFRAKTNLIDHYQNEIYATPISKDGRMFIDEEGAKKLFERYYGRKK